MEEKDVLQIINDVLLMRTGVDFKDNPELWEKHFFGSEVRIHERNLVVVVMELNKKYCLKIPWEEIAEGRCYNYKNMCSLILNSNIYSRV